MKGEIASVVWHRQGQRVELNYDDGDPDYLVGDEVVVSSMAESEGMWSVSTSEDTRRWVRR